MATVASLVVRLTADTKQYLDALYKAENATRQFAGSVTSHVQNLGNVFIKGGAIMASGLAAAGAGMAMLGKGALNSAMDFQDQMAILTSAAKSSGTGMQDLHDAALAVGSDTTLVGISAAGAAEAMTGLYKSGLSTTDIFGDLQGYMTGTTSLSGALRAAIDLQAASELDLQQASDLVAISMKTYGLNAQQAASIADNFVRTADASVTSVSELAQGLASVGPTAARFGWSLEETNQALALLSTRGIKGSEAGTALKSMMTNLMRPSKDVVETLDALNVQLYDSAGQMQSLPNIIGQLSDALYNEHTVTAVVGGRTAEQNQNLKIAESSYKAATNALYKHSTGIKTLSDKSLAKMVQQQAAAQAEMERLSSVTGKAVTSTKRLSEEERNLAIQTIAGTYGMSAMSVLLEEGPQGWEEMASAVKNASSAQEVMGLRSATLSEKWANLMGVVETLGISVGEKLIPPLTDFAAWAADMVSNYTPAIVAGVTSVMDTFGKLVEYGREVVATGNLLNSSFVNLPPALQNVITVVQQVISAGAPYAQQVMGWISSNLKLQDVLGAIGIAILSVVVPAFLALLPAIAVFALLIGGVALLRTTWEQNWGGIQEKTQTFVAFIQQLPSIIQGKLAEIQAWWAQNGQSIIATVTGAWATISTSVTTGLSFVGGLIQQGLALIASWWALHGENVLTNIGFFWGNLQTLVGMAIGMVTLVIQTALAMWQYFWEMHGEAITQAAQRAWELIQQIVSAGATIVGAIVDAMAAAISGDWHAFGENLRVAWDTAWNLIKSIVETGAQNILGIAGSLISSVINKFQSTDWPSVGRAIIDGIRDGVLNAAEGLAAAAAAAAKAALDAAKGFLGIESPSKKFMELGEMSVAGMVLGLGNVRPIERAMERVALAAFEPMRAVGEMAGVSGTSGGDVSIPINMTANVNDQVDVELIAWRVREIIGRELKQRQV